jgi:hypothetical protein
MVLDQKYITKAEFQNVYNYAGHTRAVIRGFTNDLTSCEKSPPALNS